MGACFSRRARDGVDILVWVAFMVLVSVGVEGLVFDGYLKLILAKSESICCCLPCSCL